jgi:hypothetical protein
MKRKLQALVVLLVLGVVKLPLEQRVTRDLRAARLIDEPVSVSAVESMGQSGLAAILGGARGLVASMLQLRAYTEFKRVNWGQVDSLYRIVTRLQPRNATYWDEAAWHMAYNAAGFYLYNRDGSEARNHEIRGQLYHEHVQRGAAILREGLKFSPDDPHLWERLADIYFRRSYEMAKAGDAYLEARKRGAPIITLHLAAFAYAQAPQDPESYRKAYDILKKEYDRGMNTPGVIEHLKNLESWLGIPAEKRIPDAMPQPKVPQKIPGPRN